MFPFTPSALVNLVVSLSHIRAHVYLVVLFSSKLIMIGLIGWLGNDITTLFTQPLRLVIIIIVIIVVWFIGRKLERYFMHSQRSDNLSKVVKHLISIIFAIIIVILIQTLLLQEQSYKIKV